MNFLLNSVNFSEPSWYQHNHKNSRISVSVKTYIYKHPSIDDNNMTIITCHTKSRFEFVTDISNTHSIFFPRAHSCHPSAFATSWRFYTSRGVFFFYIISYVPSSSLVFFFIVWSSGETQSFPLPNAGGGRLCFSLIVCGPFMFSLDWYDCSLNVLNVREGKAFKFSISVYNVCARNCDAYLSSSLAQSRVDSSSAVYDTMTMLELTVLYTIRIELARFKYIQMAVYIEDKLCGGKKVVRTSSGPLFRAYRTGVKHRV